MIPLSSSEAGTDLEVAVDDARQALIAELAADLGDAIVGTHVRAGDDVWVRVTREAWRETGIVLRDKLGFRAF